MKFKAYLYIFTTFILSVTSIQCEGDKIPQNPDGLQPVVKEADDCTYVDRFLGGKGSTKERVDTLRELLGGQAPYAIDKVKYLQKMIDPTSNLYAGVVNINKNLGMAGGANTTMNKVIQLQTLLYPKVDLSKAIVEINKQFGQMGGANNIYAKVQFVNQKLGSPGTSTVLKLTQITNLIGAGHAPGNRAAVGTTTYDKLNNLLARLKAHDSRLKNAKTMEEAVTLLEGPAAQAQHNPARHNPTSHK